MELLTEEAGVLLEEVCFFDGLFGLPIKLFDNLLKQPNLPLIGLQQPIQVPQNLHLLMPQQQALFTLITAHKIPQIVNIQLRKGPLQLPAQLRVDLVQRVVVEAEGFELEEEAVLVWGGWDWGGRGGQAGG